MLKRITINKEVEAHVLMNNELSADLKKSVSEWEMKTEKLSFIRWMTQFVESVNVYNKKNENV